APGTAGEIPPLEQEHPVELFQYTRAKDAGGAVAEAAQSNTAQQGAKVRFIAGGTNLVDMMKLNVEVPNKLVDVNHLPFNKIETPPEGGLSVGATVRNADPADPPLAVKNYPVLSEALLSGASA